MSFYWKPTFSGCVPTCQDTILFTCTLQYTQVCARAVRSVLKEDTRVIAVRRDEQGLKFAKWEAGKQGDIKNTANTPTVA